MLIFISNSWVKARLVAPFIAYVMSCPTLINWHFATKYPSATPACNVSWHGKTAKTISGYTPIFTWQLFVGYLWLGACWWPLELIVPIILQSQSASGRSLKYAYNIPPHQQKYIKWAISMAYHLSYSTGCRWPSTSNHASRPKVPNARDALCLRYYTVCRGTDRVHQTKMTTSFLQ